MTRQSISAQMAEPLEGHHAPMAFIDRNSSRERAGDELCQFVLGNPHEKPIEGFAKVMQEAAR